MNKLDLIKQINTDKQKQKIKRLKSLGKDPSLLFLPIITEIITQKISEINNIFINLENQDFNSNSFQNQIHSVEKKIIEINKLIDKINVIITTFQIIITTLKILPLPTAPIPTTVGIINTFSNLLEKATKIISAFKMTKSIINAEMQQVQNTFTELKDKINNETSNINSTSKNTNIKIGTYPETYKGFKFAIREEKSNDLIKRHYGVAIDNSGVEVLKTEKSYTLDTYILIDELKLIIDKNNLKA